MPRPQLPSARTFLTDLFLSLPAASDHGNKNDSNKSAYSSSSILNPLKDLRPGAQRNIFLTLHVLFPNELLPALDLLDRRLVTRVVITSPGTSPCPPPPPTSGPRQQEAGPAAGAREAAETAQQVEGNERAAEENTSPATSRCERGRDLDGNDLLLSTSSNSDARNPATDRNSTATTATGSIAVAGNSAAEQQPGVDAATTPAASISGCLLSSSTRSEDDDATAAASAARCARGHAAGQPENTEPGQSNSAAITSRAGDASDGDAATGARNLTNATRNEDGEQTTQFQVPVASGGLAVAPSSPRRADASAYCDNDDDERGEQCRAENVGPQSRNHLHHRHQRQQRQEANQDQPAIQDTQPCPSPQDVKDVRQGNLEQGPAQDGQASSSSHHVVFYVRSASSSTSNSLHYQSQHHPPPHVYEVRLSAWHCTCPAFAFAAFPASASGADAESSLSDCPSSPRSGDCDWSFGGLSRDREKGAVPLVCKHLLACLLIERAPGLFGVDADAHAGGDVADGGLAMQRRVSVFEAAGWAAGWGGL